MRRVRALPPTGFEPALFPTPLQQQIQQTLFGLALDQACAKFSQDAMVKAGIGQLQAKRVFPSEPLTYRISSLAIGQAFEKLEDGDQCQPPGRESRLTMRRKQVSKRLVRVDTSQRVTQLHEHIATRKDGLCHTSGFFRNRGDGQRFERHRWPPN
jgi:hypothetical protein